MDEQTKNIVASMGSAYMSNNSNVYKDVYNDAFLKYWNSRTGDWDTKALEAAYASAKHYTSTKTSRAHWYDPNVRKFEGQDEEVSYE